MSHPIAAWILGPVGSGKSTCIAGLQGFAVVDQDADLERLLRLNGLPFDTRKYTASQAARVKELRQEASDRTWDMVPALRSSGQSIVFESTGDKPWLLAEEMSRNRDAGYVDIGFGLSTQLSDCLAQNRSRARVLPDSVIESSWQTFHQYLMARRYHSLFGEDRFLAFVPTETPDLLAFMKHQLNRMSS